jgi:hypothetical protein
VAWRSKRFCLLKYYSDEKQKDKNLIQNNNTKENGVDSFIFSLAVLGFVCYLWLGIDYVIQPQAGWPTVTNLTLC